MKGNLPGLQPLRLHSHRSHAYCLFTDAVERREDFVRKLAECGVPCSVVHLRIDDNSVFGGPRLDLPGQENFNEHQVAMPLHEALGEADTEKAVAAIRPGWQ